MRGIQLTITCQPQKNPSPGETANPIRKCKPLFWSEFGPSWRVQPPKTKHKQVRILDVYLYHGPPKATFLVVFMVNNLVSSWPKPFFSWFWGSWYRYIYIYATVLCIRTGPVSDFVAKRTFNRLLQLTSISNWHPSGRFKQLRDVVDWLAGCAGGELESPFLKGPPKTHKDVKKKRRRWMFSYFFWGVP